MRELDAIIDGARWAPSGDNLQPWRFETDGDRITVHVTREPEDTLDQTGAMALFSCGCLMETLRLVALGQGREAHWTLETVRGAPVIRIALTAAPESRRPADQRRLAQVARRATDRRPYLRRPLSCAEKEAIELAAAGYPVVWLEGLGATSRLIAANALATEARLLTAEGARGLRAALHFDATHPMRGLAGASLGICSLSQRILRWALGAPRRARLLWRTGALAVSHLESAVLPGLASGGHLALVSTSDDPDSPQARLAAGAAFQRLWLEAAALGLALQPHIGMLALAQADARGEVVFAARHARRIGALVGAILPVPLTRVVALARIGEPRAALESRSLRLPVPALLAPEAQAP